MADKMIAWIDVESTGTSPDRDMILEIAGIVTDMQSPDRDMILEIAGINL